MASKKFGSAVVRLKWPDDNTIANTFRAEGHRRVDCSGEGIETITIEVYDGPTKNLLKKRPFKCNLHSGTIEDIPVGPNRLFKALGKTADGVNIFEGQAEDWYEISAEGMTYVDDIDMKAVFSMCYYDGDDDGYGDSSKFEDTEDKCPEGYVAASNGADCDDGNDRIYPGANEVADNNVDEDCSGKPARTWIIDADGDGCGNSARSIVEDDPPEGYVLYSAPEDCNDNNSGIHPGAVEIPGNTIDEDCDGDDPKRTIMNELGMTFAYIPKGSFDMGSPETELGKYDNETLHHVTLTQPFYMQTTEVTQSQWEEVMGENPSYFTECGGDCPVEQVSWNDIQNFIFIMNDRGDGTYRLPTEAEWEYAARAGTSTAIANGDISFLDCSYDRNLDAMGWYCGNSGVYYDNCDNLSDTDGPTCAGPHRVAQKTQNAWGLYDMHGNVWEWCADWYGFYPSGSVTDPIGPNTGSSRVLRGGSWDYFAVFSRSASRTGNRPDTRFSDYGFRLVFSQVSSTIE